MRRLLVEEEGFRLLDLSLDSYLFGDSVNLFAARALFDLHLRRAVGRGGRCAGGRSRRLRVRRATCERQHQPNPGGEGGAKKTDSRCSPCEHHQVSPYLAGGAAWTAGAAGQGPPERQRPVRERRSARPEEGAAGRQQPVRKRAGPEEGAPAGAAPAPGAALRPRSAPAGSPAAAVADFLASSAAFLAARAASRSCCFLRRSRRFSSFLIWSCASAM